MGRGGKGVREGIKGEAWGMRVRRENLTSSQLKSAGSLLTNLSLMSSIFVAFPRSSVIPSMKPSSVSYDERESHDEEGG